MHYWTTTQTIVKVENKEGDVREYVLRDICTREHNDSAYVDQDYDFEQRDFFHTDGSDPCLGTWYNPMY